MGRPTMRDDLSKRHTIRNLRLRPLSSVKLVSMGGSDRGGVPKLVSISETNGS